MSAFFGHVAGASLPVAIGLLLLAAVARGALWAEVDDARAQRIARQYVEPLSTWCLIAVGLNGLGLAAAGDSGLLSLALPLGIGLVAVLLRPEDATSEPSPVEPEEQPTAPAPAATEPESPTVGPLWARWGR